MKLKKTSANRIVITTHEKQWMLVILALLIVMFAAPISRNGVNTIGLAAYSIVFLTWTGFAYYAANTKIILDKQAQEFLYEKHGFFKTHNNFQCALNEITDVVLEKSNSDGDTCYNISFVTNNHKFYSSRIYHGGYFNSVKKHYETIRIFMLPYLYPNGA